MKSKEDLIRKWFMALGIVAAVTILLLILHAFNQV